MRSQISINNYVNQIPIKTSKHSDHILIKHINVQSLIRKLGEIKLLIENEDIDISNGLLNLIWFILAHVICTVVTHVPVSMPLLAK